MSLPDVEDSVESVLGPLLLLKAELRSPACHSANKWPSASLPEASHSSYCASRCALERQESCGSLQSSAMAGVVQGWCCQRLRELCAELSLGTFSLLHCCVGSVHCSEGPPKSTKLLFSSVCSICLELALNIKGTVMVQSAGDCWDIWRQVLKLQGLQRGLKCLFCSGGAFGAAAAAKLKELCILKPEQKTDCLCLFSVWQNALPQIVLQKDAVFQIKSWVQCM